MNGFFSQVRRLGEWRRRCDSPVPEIAFYTDDGDGVRPVEPNHRIASYPHATQR